MNHDAFEASTQHQLHELAKTEAQRLRDQAMRDFGRVSMDDFWRGANAVWQRGQATARRSATRLQARLARRARSATSNTLSTGA